MPRGNPGKIVAVRQPQDPTEQRPLDGRILERAPEQQTRGTLATVEAAADPGRLDDGGGHSTPLQINARNAPLRTSSRAGCAMCERPTARPPALKAPTSTVCN